jgi:DNA-binding MarR family transcriptional regulator
MMKRRAATDDPLDRVSRECIAVRVRLINRVITALYDEALRPHGLRVSQGNILVAVARRGEVRPAEVCRMLRIEKSTLSRDVDLMKKEGWLASEPPAGGRNQTLRMTPAGSALLRRAQPAWEQAQAEARSLIGEAGVDALGQIAVRLGLGKTTD